MDIIFAIAPDGEDLIVCPFCGCICDFTTGLQSSDYVTHVMLWCEMCGARSVLDPTMIETILHREIQRGPNGPGNDDYTIADSIPYVTFNSVTTALANVRDSENIIALGSQTFETQALRRLIDYLASTENNYMYRITVLRLVRILKVMNEDIVARQILYINPKDRESDDLVHHFDDEFDAHGCDFRAGLTVDSFDAERP